MSAIRALSVLCVVLFVSIGVAIAAEEEEPPKLLGACTAEQMDEEPFSEWFRSGYDDYSPTADVLEALRGADSSDVRVTIFFGTWCGDSRREVPRWLKLFDAMGFPSDRVRLIAVDNTDESHKRSPGGEEQGLEIYRVPTMIVERDGAEVARVVEYPVLSIERDLLAILEGRNYQPNYVSFPIIRRWLGDGLLSDPNVSARGLAGEVRHLVAGEGELGAAARVLLTRGDVAESVKLGEANCALYGDSARCRQRLAEAYLQAGDRESARKAAERALRLNDDPERVESLVELIEQSGTEEPAIEQARSR